MLHEEILDVGLYLSCINVRGLFEVGQLVLVQTAHDEREVVGEIGLADLV